VQTREDRIVDRAVDLFADAAATGRWEQAEQAATIAWAVARQRDEPPLEESVNR
jgi:hypothetical protein